MKSVKTVTLVCLFALLLPACAHRHFEDDKRDPNYHLGLYNPGPSVVSMDPNLAVQPASNVAALVLAGAFIAANPDYYRKIAISGRCLARGAGDSAMELPCTHVDVVLESTQGKELSRVQVENGEFAFRVEPKIPYRLRVDSPRWKMDPPVAREAYLGDDVVLHVVRAPAKPSR